MNSDCTWLPGDENIAGAPQRSNICNICTEQHMSNNLQFLHSVHGDKLNLFKTFNRLSLSLNVLSEYSYNIYTIGSNLVEVIDHVITAPGSLPLLTVGGEAHLLGPHLRRSPLPRRQGLLLLLLKLPPTLLGSLEIILTLSALFRRHVYLQLCLDVLLIISRDGGGRFWSRHLLGPRLLEHHLVPEAPILRLEVASPRVCVPSAALHQHADAATWSSCNFVHANKIAPL